MLNRFECIGHIGEKAEVKELESGVKVAKFSVAIKKRGYKTSAGVDVPEKTTWVTIIAWRGLAELVERFTDKGSQVFVSGELSIRTYEKDGNKFYVTEVIADNIELLGRKPEGGVSEKPTSHTPEKVDLPEYNDGLPFLL